MPARMLTRVALLTLLAFGAVLVAPAPTAAAEPVCVGPACVPVPEPGGIVVGPPGQGCRPMC